MAVDKVRIPDGLTIQYCDDPLPRGLKPVAGTTQSVAVHNRYALRATGAPPDRPFRPVSLKPGRV